MIRESEIRKEILTLPCMYTLNKMKIVLKTIDFKLHAGQFLYVEYSPTQRPECVLFIYKDEYSKLLLTLKGLNDNGMTKDIKLIVLNNNFHFGHHSENED